MAKSYTFGNTTTRKVWANFAKGYNSVRQPQDLTSEELADVMNFRYVLTPSGIGLTNRPGMVKLTSDPLISTNTAVKDIHKYTNTAGTSQYLAVSGTSVFMHTSGTGTWGSATSSLAGTRGRMVNFAGKTIIADGGTLKQYNGTAVSTCTTSVGSVPSATFLAVHGDRLLANSASVKNALYYCNVRDPNDWGTVGATGTIYISESNELTGFSKFYDKVLIHGINPKNIMGMTGTTPMDIQVGRVIPGAAAVGPDQAIVLSNDVLFMDSPGLISFRAWQNYGDIEQSIVSDPVSNLLLPYVGTGYVCGRSPIDQQAWFWDGSSSYILIYDTQFRIWTKYKLELGTGVTPTCIADLDGVLFVGTSNGHVWKMDTTGAIFKDNSVDYSLYWKGYAADFGTLKKKSCRFFFPQMTATAGATANACLYKDLSTAALMEVALTAPPVRILSTLTGTGDTVLLATYAVEETGGIVKTTPAKFEFTYLQAGMEDVLANNGRLTVNPHSVEAAILSRY